MNYLDLPFFGVPFINALLVPKVFYLAGVMDEAERLGATKLLMDLGRYSRKAIEYAGDSGRQELEFFLPV